MKQLSKAILVSILAFLFGATASYAETVNDCVGLGLESALAEALCGPVTHDGTVTINSGDVDLATSGKTVIWEDGTAASTCFGNATANGATAVTVTTTCAQTGDHVMISRSSAPSGTAICWATNIVDGVSFDLDCSAAETGTFHWVILKGQ